MTAPIPARVAARAAIRYNIVGDCYVSTYSVGSHGYAQIGWKEPGVGVQMTTAQRAAYVHHSGGQIPDGVTVDHTCHTRTCVRREHLRPLSNAQNAERNSADGDFPLEWSCRRNHPESARIRIARKTKKGERRWSWTCGECMAESRARYAEKHADRVKASQQKYNATRNVNQ